MTLVRTLKATLPFILCCLCLSGNSESVGSEPFPREINNGAVCGILCAQAVLGRLGLGVPQLADLAKRKYLSGQDGSTSSDLQLIFEDNGLSSGCFTGLTPRSLLLLENSVLLRVNNVATQTQHWVVYCGVSSSGYMIADVPSPPYAISESELASIWTGSGVVIGPAWETLLRTKLAWFLLDVIPALTCPFVVFFGLQLAMRRAVNAWVQTLTVAIMILGSLTVRHSTSQDGFVMNRDAMKNVEFRFAKAIEIPRLRSFNDVDFRATIFVDSRLPSSFRLGHVPGAINLPTYATRYERNRALLGIGKDQNIVVYCQSERCTFADIVANQLTLEGFKRVAIFEKGWLGFEKELSKGISL